MVEEKHWSILFALFVCVQLTSWSQIGNWEDRKKASVNFPVTHIMQHFCPTHPLELSGNWEYGIDKNQPFPVVWVHIRIKMNVCYLPPEADTRLGRRKEKHQAFPDTHLRFCATNLLKYWKCGKRIISSYTLQVMYNNGVQLTNWSREEIKKVEGKHQQFSITWIICVQLTDWNWDVIRKLGRKASIIFILHISCMQT